MILKVPVDISPARGPQYEMDSQAGNGIGLVVFNLCPFPLLLHPEGLPELERGSRFHSRQAAVQLPKLLRPPTLLCWASDSAALAGV